MGWKTSRSRLALVLRFLLGSSHFVGVGSAPASVWVVPSPEGVETEIERQFQRSNWVVLARVALLNPSRNRVPAADQTNSLTWIGELEVLEHFVVTGPRPSRMPYFHWKPDMGSGPPGIYTAGDTIVAFIRCSATPENGVMPMERGWSPRLDGNRVSVFGRDNDLDRDSLLTLCRKLGRKATPEHARNVATLAVRGKVLEYDWRLGAARVRVREAAGIGSLPSVGDNVWLPWPSWQEPPRPPRFGLAIAPADEVVAFLSRDVDKGIYCAPPAPCPFWTVEGDRCVIEMTHGPEADEPQGNCYGQRATTLRSVPRDRVLALLRGDWSARRAGSPGDSIVP